MKTLIVILGMPGSGKTKLINKLFDQNVNHEGFLNKSFLMIETEKYTEIEHTGFNAKARHFIQSYDGPVIQILVDKPILKCLYSIFSDLFKFKRSLSSTLSRVKCLIFYKINEKYLESEQKAIRVIFNDNFKP